MLGPRARALHRAGDTSRALEKRGVEGESCVGDADEDALYWRNQFRRKSTRVSSSLCQSPSRIKECRDHRFLRDDWRVDLRVFAAVFVAFFAALASTSSTRSTYACFPSKAIAYSYTGEMPAASRSWA